MGCAYHFGCVDVPTPTAASAACEQIHCDICGAAVPFEEYGAHLASHDESFSVASEVGARAETDRHGTSFVSVPTQRDKDLIPCELCSKLVSFEEYESHLASHAHEAVHEVDPVSPTVPCERCGAEVPWAEYLAHMTAHEAETQGRTSGEEARLQRSREPDDIAMQVVALARREGAAFQGGRDACNFDVVANFVRQMHAFAEGGDRQ